jgi:hypothetical protein
VASVFGEVGAFTGSAWKPGVTQPASHPLFVRHMQVVHVCLLEVLDLRISQAMVLVIILNLAFKDEFAVLEQDYMESSLEGADGRCLLVLLVVDEVLDGLEDLVDLGSLSGLDEQVGHDSKAGVLGELKL